MANHNLYSYYNIFQYIMLQKNVCILALQKSGGKLAESLPVVQLYVFCMLRIGPVKLISYTNW